MVLSAVGARPPHDGVFAATAPPATSPSNPAASCRCTGQADRAGRADQMASRRPASRARVRAAQAVNALSVLQIFRSVGDDPVPRCARSAPAPSPPPRPGEADIRQVSPRRARCRLARAEKRKVAIAAQLAATFMACHIIRTGGFAALRGRRPGAPRRLCSVHLDLQALF